jgi:RNA polymerase sigma-70 factor (ECF subfamily)
VEAALTSTLGSPTAGTVEAISREAFDDIIRLHQRRVYRVIFLLVRDPDTADTLTQECFLRAYQGRGSFRGECRIETWLLRIATNLVRDHGKNRRANFWRRLIGLEDATSAKPAEIHTPGAVASPERIVLAQEKAAAVWAALPALSSQQRVIFTLRFMEEMPLEEIAGVLGLQVGSVKAQLCRATAKVREIVRKQYGDHPTSQR